MSNYKEEMIKSMKTSFKENIYEEINEESAKENGVELTEEEKQALKRHNFSYDVRIRIGARVGFRYCYPDCKQVTIGPDDQESFVILGEAAHIYAASKNTGSKRIPRIAPESMKDEDIVSFNNGIWLCRHHHKLVDTIWNNNINSPEELKKWKSDAEAEQAEDLEMKQPELIKEIFERIPNTGCSGRIELSKFKNSEWGLVLYLYDRQKHHTINDRNMADYVSWLQEKGIKPSDVGLVNYENYHWEFSNISRVYEYLVTIVEFDDEGNILTGENFEALIDDLLETDIDFFNQMISEMKTKYPR